MKSKDMPIRRNTQGIVYTQEEYLDRLQNIAENEPKKARGRPKGSLNGSSKKDKFSFKVTHETFILSFD